MLYSEVDGTAKSWAGDWRRRRRRIGAWWLAAVLVIAVVPWIGGEFFFSNPLRLGGGGAPPASTGDSPLGASAGEWPSSSAAVSAPWLAATAPTVELTPDPMPEVLPEQKKPPASHGKRVHKPAKKRPLSASTSRRQTAHKAPFNSISQTPAEETRPPQPSLRINHENHRPPAAAAGAGWYAALQAELRRCADGDNFLSRLICAEKVKFHFCGPGKHWGEVPECVQAHTVSNY